MEYQVDTSINLLILPGGPDMDSTDTAYMNPENPRGFVSRQQQSSCPIYNYFIKNTLELYITADIPIFGVCLGFQVLAAYFGSKLFADIEGHSDPSKMHKIVLDDSLIIRKDQQISKNLSVNSYHHQAIKTLGEALVPVAHAIDSNKEPFLVEAFSHKSLAIAGVQWHPERIYNRLDSYTYKQTGKLIGDELTNLLINRLILGL